MVFNTGSHKQLTGIQKKCRGPLAFPVKSTVYFFNRKKNKGNSSVFCVRPMLARLCAPGKQPLKPRACLSHGITPNSDIAWGQAPPPIPTGQLKGSDGGILFIPRCWCLEQGLAHRRCREIFVNQTVWKMKIMHLEKRIK